MPKISEEKRQARRLEILEAAARCFAREGFHRTSMEDIVCESKLSPGAIYCYFGGKHEIVAALAQQRHQWESAMLDELTSAKNFPEGLEKLMRGIVANLTDKREKRHRRVSIQFWAESLLDKKIRKIVERGLRQREPLTKALRKAQKSGQVARNLDADSLSRVMLSLLHGFILQQAWEPELDVAGYLETASALIRSIYVET